MSTLSMRRRQAMAVVFGCLAPMVGPSPTTRAAQGTAAVREIEIVVDGGYSPARVTIRPGERVRLKFVRKEWNGCTRELVIPALNVRRELPPNTPVLVDVPPLARGEYEFRCGMKMIRGAIVVQEG